MAMIVNVCPAATTAAPPDSVWQVIGDVRRWSEWTDAVVIEADPPGPMQAGQVVRLAAPWLRWLLQFTIDIRGIDPQRRWIDLVARFPFGIENYEHLTLTETPEGGTLVRFN